MSHDISTSDAEGSYLAVLRGGFDEDTDFDSLRERLKSATHIDFMLAELGALNSGGIRLWCLFLGTLDEATTYTFHECSVPFALQGAMMPMVVGRGKVRSTRAPYYCAGCDVEETHLIECSAVVQADGSLVAPKVLCKSCSQEMEFDDLPERYFAFLLEWCGSVRTL